MRMQGLPPSDQAAVPLIAGSADDPALAAWRQLFETFFKFQRRLEQLVLPRGLALSQFEALCAWESGRG